MMGLSFVVDPQGSNALPVARPLRPRRCRDGVDHVGLGADFVDQVRRPMRGAASVRYLVRDGPGRQEALRTRRVHRTAGVPIVVAALRRRGYDGQRLEALLSRNWLRILREALPP